MDRSFARCFRTLGRDKGRSSRIGMILVMAILTVWGGWSAMARVKVFAVSTDARLESVSAAHPIATPFTGRVVESHLVVGRDVVPGDLLLVIDHEVQHHELIELETKRAAMTSRLEAARLEVRAFEQSLTDGEKAATAAVEEAAAKREAATVQARFNQEIADFYADLNENGHAARIELIRTDADAAKASAEAEGFRLAVNRLEWDWQRLNSETRAELERAKAVVAELEGAIETNSAAADRIRNEIERHHIRAFTSGKIGQIGDVKVGAVVRAGDRLGDIVPDDTLHIVAHFKPADAIGRIQPGQPARMRLHGFPWTQYGSAVATVASVGSELRNGAIRVELAVSTLPSIPYSSTHGLPGTVEIEVERVSPATLVLRSTGYFLTDVDSNATLATINAG